MKTKQKGQFILSICYSDIVPWLLCSRNCGCPEEMVAMDQDR